MVDPNIAYRDRNKPTKNHNAVIAFSKSVLIELTCRNCGYALNMNMTPGTSFNPAFVTCMKCGADATVVS